MNWNYGARAARYRAFNQIRVDVRRSGINIHQDRLRPAIGDGFGGCQKCIRSRNDFVAGLHSEREQTQMKSSGAATESYAVLRSAKFREFLLQRFHLLALNERGRLANTVERRQDFVAQLRVFRLEIEEWNLHL